MEKIITYLARLLIPAVLGLVAGVMITQKCHQQTQPTPIYDTTEIVVYDTIIRQADTVYYPEIVPYKSIVTIYDTVTEIDTVEVIKDYYAARLYKDTLVNDSDLFFYIEQTIYKNAIQERQFRYRNRRPVDFVCPDRPRPPGVVVGAGVHFTDDLNFHLSGGYIRGRLLYQAHAGKNFGAVGVSFVF